MTAREYLDSLEDSKNAKGEVQATKFIPFIGSKSEIEKAEQTRKLLAKGQSLANTSTKPDSYLSEVKVDNQPEKSLSF